MKQYTWFITGVSSGFGYEITKQLLKKGNIVIGTVRNRKKIEDLLREYPKTFNCKILDMIDVSAVYEIVKESFEEYKKIDIVVSNAGYGLFGAIEELSNIEINHIIATNLTGSITLIKASLPYMRKQGGGRIIQISSYGGQVAFTGNSMYHATKFGIEGFCEAVAQEVEPFNIGVTLVEPGGARTEFRYGSAKIGNLIPEYNHCHGFLDMLNPSKGLASGDPKKMAARIIESVEINPAPLHMVLGSQALNTTIIKLKERVLNYEMQKDLVASTILLNSYKKYLKYICKLLKGGKINVNIRVCKKIS